MKFDPLKPIKDNDALLSDEIGRMHELAFRDGELSKKHKLLIAMAIDAAAHAENGVRALATQAMENGATRRSLLLCCHQLHSHLYR
ncbi:carboxymuconolactone decarboxylase family protein [bacterium]|nr:carboxymuconolactone decarboxylase family protein [candidate division CSSED10-310 bacterium]